MFAADRKKESPRLFIFVWHHQGRFRFHSSRFRGSRLKTKRSGSDAPSKPVDRKRPGRHFSFYSMPDRHAEKDQMISAFFFQMDLGSRLEVEIEMDNFISFWKPPGSVGLFVKRICIKRQHYSNTRLKWWRIKRKVILQGNENAAER